MECGRCVEDTDLVAQQKVEEVSNEEEEADEEILEVHKETGKEHDAERAAEESLGLADDAFDEVELGGAFGKYKYDAGHVNLMPELQFLTTSMMIH